MTETTPRIYVGTYAKYNSGSISGKWLDLEDYADKEAFLGACAELHKDEADPEFMFQDYEGFPSDYYSESSVPDALFDWLELDEDDRELLARYQDAIGDTASIEAARDAYAGTYDTLAGFAQEFIEETMSETIPQYVVVDWDATWNCNLRHDFTTSRGDDGVFVFHNQ